MTTKVCRNKLYCSIRIGPSDSDYNSYTIPRPCFDQVKLHSVLSVMLSILSVTHSATCKCRDGRIDLIL